MVSVNGQFADDWVRHSVLLERFKNGEVKRMMAFLNKDVIPSIVAKADKIASRYERLGYSKLAIARRRRALLKQLKGMEAVVKGGTNLLSARLNGTMKTLAKSEAKWAAQTLQRRLPLRANYTLPSPQLLKSIVTTKPMTGRFLKDWAKDVGANTARKVNQAIMVGVAQGEGVETIVRRIRGTAASGFKDGVLQATRNEAAMVTRTAVNHVGQHAREAVFAENKNVVEQVQWLSVLDSRTSQICASLDSQTYEVNKGPRPPAHPNCRSVMIPVVKPPQGIPGIDSSKLPVGQRAAMGGPVPGNMTFGSWLKGQPAKVQNEILGVGKGKLYRRGKVPIEKFSDVKGGGVVRPLSLKQLEAIEARLVGNKTARRRVKSEAADDILVAKGPMTVLKTLIDHQQSTVSLAQVRVSVASVTGKQTSQAYLPKMLNQLRALGLVARLPGSQVGGVWEVTALGRSGRIKLGKAVKKKPVAKVTPAPAPAPIVDAPGSGAELRRQILALKEEARVGAAGEADEVKALISVQREKLIDARHRYNMGLSGPGGNDARSAAYDEMLKARAEITILKSKLFELGADAASGRRGALLGGSEGLKARARKMIASGGDADVQVSFRQAGGIKVRDYNAAGNKIKVPSLPVEDVVKARAKKAQEFLNATVRVGKDDPTYKYWPIDEFDGKKLKLKLNGLPRGGRAYQSGSEGVFIDHLAGDVRTIVHEIGHCLEDALFQRQARQYRRFRSMKKKRNGDYTMPRRSRLSSGDGDEVAWADEFDRPYTGRYYGDNGPTEIISMYLEALYHDPIHFAKVDPRGFDFIIDLVRGTPLEKQSWFTSLGSAERAFILEQG